MDPSVSRIGSPETDESIDKVRQMYSTNIEPSFNEGQKNNKNICDAFGCSSEATEKLGVNAGTFGTITLKLCPKCIIIFKRSKI